MIRVCIPTHAHFFVSFTRLKARIQLEKTPIGRFLCDEEYPWTRVRYPHETRTGTSVKNPECGADTAPPWQVLTILRRLGAAHMRLGLPGEAWDHIGEVRYCRGGVIQ